jgi:hypothetical protein
MSPYYVLVEIDHYEIFLLKVLPLFYFKEKNKFSMFNAL